MNRVQPLVVVAGIAFTLIYCFLLTGLLVVLRYQVRRLSSQTPVRAKEIANLAAELEAQALLSRQMSLDLEELRNRVLERQETLPPASPGWSTAGMPVNLNRRGQILRLSRKGKSVAEIASDLNVAQGEVDLLLKVHDLSQTKPNLEN